MNIISITSRGKPASLKKAGEMRATNSNTLGKVTVDAIMMAIAAESLASAELEVRLA